MLDWTGGDARPPSNNLFFLFLLRLFWLLGSSRFCAFFALHLLLAFLDDLRLGRSGTSLSSNNFRSGNFFFLYPGNGPDSLIPLSKKLKLPAVAYFAPTNTLPKIPACYA